MNALRFPLRHTLTVGLLAAAGSLSTLAMAAELPAGTVISAANLDQVKNDTF